MQISDIRVVQDIETLLKEFDGYEQKYDNVTFYCRDLNSFYHNDVLQPNTLGGIIIQRLFDMSPNIREIPSDGNNIKIVTPNFIDKSALIDGRETIRNGKFNIRRLNKVIEVHTVIDEADPIEKFVKELINLANKNKKEYEKVKNFTDAANELVKNYDANKSSIQSNLDELQKSIIQKAEVILENENFAPKEEVKESISNAFNKLKSNIEKTSKQTYGYTVKELIKALVSIIDFTEFKNTFKPVSLLMSAGDIYETGSKIYEHSKKKGFYAFAGPVANLLASEFGFIFGLLNASSLSNVLVFKTKSGESGGFIDFSGFEADGLNAQTNVDEYLGVCGDFIFNENKKDGEMDFRNNPLKPNYLPGSVYQLKNNIELSSADFFDIRSKIRKAQNGNVSIYKNTGKKDKDSYSLYESVEISIVSNGAHFVYIQHPFFNSLKFAHLIRDKSAADKDRDTNSLRYGKLAKNYLVLSNAPLKTNAKLSEYIVETALSYKINDENNRSDKDPKLIKPGEINQVKDYSKYSISVNAKEEEDLYLLNLSPFVRISRDILEEFEDDIKDAEEAFMNMVTTKEEEQQDAISHYLAMNAIADESNLKLQHIDSFFRSPDDMEDIKEKEEEFLKTSIKEFADYFKTINKKYEVEMVYTESNSQSLGKYGSKQEVQNLISGAKRSGIRGECKVTEYPYSAIDIFLLATTFYVIRQKFDQSLIEFNSPGGFFSSNDGEYITVYDERFKLLNDDAFLQTSEGKKRIYFFKQTMQSAREKDAVCIEEIVDGFENGFVENGMQIFEDSFYEFFKDFEKEYGSNFDDKVTQDERWAYEDLKKAHDNAMRPFKSVPMNEDYKFYIDMSLSTIVDEVLEELFPFYGYFKGEGYANIAKSMTNYIFSKSGIKEIFMENIGEFRIFASLGSENIRAMIADEKKARRLSKKLKVKAFAGIVEIKKNIFAYYEVTDNLNSKDAPIHLKKLKNISKEYQADIHKSVRLKAMGKFFTNSAKTTLKTIITGSGLNFILDSLYTSEYEKHKRQYEDILYKYYTHKYDEPYAVKNISLAPMSKYTKEYIYYPMNIRSSFMNVDLKRTIIGGRLSSGGLDYHKFFYYDINDIYTKTNSSLSKNMPLNKLIAYLCLDELRTTYKDDQSFFNHLKTHDMPFAPKELMVADSKRPLDISNSSFMDYTQRREIYEMYKEAQTRGKSMANMESAIDSYNEAMEILQDFKEGNFNTDTTDKESRVDNKARRLLQALDVIGKNNIKGLYVGCKAPKNRPRTEKEIPPRLIGRLATTIIMEDGLFIG
ncbi:hypothetical protein [Campylobacter showae]|uniref:hypothetical protein n=1 Tax=Campylobacter showae TaxID=204 RepID=UPI0026ED6C7A|nr:hypothetical protein [Campylobacter showae]